MIEIKELSVKIDNKDILKNVDLKVNNKEIYVILGPSGCGKSVFLHTIVGLIKPVSGLIFIDGENLLNCTKKELETIRKKIGFLFQHSALFDSMTIEENLKFPLLQHTKLSEYEMSRKINERLSLVGLTNINDKKPSELSGGMQKRVALARSVILEPDYIFYDEPTTGLDPIMSSVINQLITDLNNRLGTTSIVVTHDMKSAFSIADRIGLLYGGNIVVQGTTEDMRTKDNPYLKQFLNGHQDGPIIQNIKE